MLTDPERWTTAALIDPVSTGFVQLSVRAGNWPIPPALPSRRRRRVRAMIHELADDIRDDVLEATVFTALVRPPGGGAASAEAAFDLVLLVETADAGAARALIESDAWRSRVEAIAAASVECMPFVATNPRRMNPVDHSRGGVFLFNYFTAPTVEANLFAWQYTAGWFQDQTGLDNSTVLQPVAGQGTPFTLVNHCRWDHLRDVLPDLAFTRSFRTFVLRVFAENGVQPRPLLYRISRR